MKQHWKKQLSMIWKHRDEDESQLTLAHIEALIADVKRETQRQTKQELLERTYTPYERTH